MRKSLQEHRRWRQRSTGDTTDAGKDHRRRRPRLLGIIRLMDASAGMAARVVVWPTMLPFLLAALQIATSRAVSAAIGEMLMGDRGLGFLIERLRQTFDTAGLFGDHPSCSGAAAD